MYAIFFHEKSFVKVRINVGQVGGVYSLGFLVFNYFLIQIWLNYIFDDHIFNYITKMEKKREPNGFFI
jgi:hypothetical protein